MNNEFMNCASSGQNSASETETGLGETLLYKLAELTKQIKELNANISRVQEEYYRRLEQLQSQKKPLEDALHHVKALLQFERRRKLERSKRRASSVSTRYHVG